MDLDELSNRVDRQTWLDGIPDLVTGTLMLTYSLLFSLPSLFTKGSTGAHVYSFVQSILLVATNFTLSWAYKKLKARLAYPHTGYAATIKPSNRRLLICIAIGFFAPIGMFVIESYPQFDWPAAGIASYTIFMALTLGISGIRMNLPHMQALALFTLLLGIAFTGRFPFITAMVWYNLFIGAAMFVTGAFRLRTFLKTHPQ